MILTLKKENRSYLIQQMGKFPSQYELLDKYNPELADCIVSLRRANFPRKKDSKSAIPLKYKELIVVAIEVATGRGEKGISHARKAVRAGASMQEIMETLGLCMYLTGMTTWVDSGGSCIRAASDELIHHRRVKASTKNSN